MAAPEENRLDVVIRPPESLHRASGKIQGGTFQGLWHFSFDEYHDPEHVQFGNLRVLNDDTLSPGSIWPLHPHTQNEVVTYVAAGEFRHEDERGLGGILHQGGVQHTTVGRGMYHSEINNQPSLPMRFIQLWFMPHTPNLPPSVEQREVDRRLRTNRWLPLVSSRHEDTLPLRADAAVLSSFLEAGHTVHYPVTDGRGLYLYVLDGGPVTVDGRPAPRLSAVEVRGSGKLDTRADRDAELLLIDVNLFR